MSQIEKHGWNIDHLVVVTAVLNPEVNDDDIYMTVPEGWKEGLNVPMIHVQLNDLHYTLQQEP
jgi:hypothetical protein